MKDNDPNPNPLVLVTGATGYIGARLVPRLLENGYRVRVMVRDPQRLLGRDWQSQVEIVTGDVLKPDTLPAAVAGVDVAYYLIHSMLGHDDFVERDVTAARNFATAAKEAGVDRILYLSGLGHEEDEELSEHLRSRHLTGDTLRESGLDVTEFRAAVIVGSGSISFEMVRNLTERLPIMIVPKWATTRIQPIGISDVLAYLVAALKTPASRDKIIEIGGADVVTYLDMMKQYAAERSLKRRFISVPLLTPHLSSYWVHWTTPIPSTIAHSLIEGLRNEVVVTASDSAEIFPDIQPLTYREAVRRALDRIRSGRVESIWSDALSSSQGDRAPTFFKLEQGMLIERRLVDVNASPANLFRAFSSLGGKRGWLAFNWSWRLRGALDRAVGGVGMRRGRRDPNSVRVGDALDFWRVEAVEPNELIRLRAEMKVPGRAWLQFEANEPAETDIAPHTELIQTAYFAPRGLGGLLYWYLLYPIHGLIFSQMPKRIAEMAEQFEETTNSAETTPVSQPQTKP